MVEMGTFVAILIGTIVGGQLAGITDAGPLWIAGVTIAIAIAGRFAASFIPSAPPSDAGLVINWNPFLRDVENLKLAKTSRPVFLSLLGYLVAVVLRRDVPDLVLQFREGCPRRRHQCRDDAARGVLGRRRRRLAAVRAHVGHKVEIGLVPFGSIGMSLFAADLYFASRGLHPTGISGLGAFFGNHAHWRVLDRPVPAVDVRRLLFGAAVRADPEPVRADARARIIAANNILNALFMIVSALLGYALLSSGFTIPQLFLLTAILNAVVAIYIYSLVPEFLMRFLCWLLVHSVYRVSKSGIDRIPDQGPAVIVCNHVSFVDALIIMAASPRPVRFVMDHQIFKVPVLSFVFRTANAIPIASAKEDPALLERAFEDVARALEAGELVGIFPEGRIRTMATCTRSGAASGRFSNARPFPSCRSRCRACGVHTSAARADPQ
jgi:1-acyl-sn-glycerol-3-phosphate acyltransferase